MSFVIRIRTWRARRKERKAEQLVGLTKTDTAEADRMRYDYGQGNVVNDGQHQGFVKHAFQSSVFS